jgi:hypothetical protein
MYAIVVFKNREPTTKEHFGVRVQMWLVGSLADVGVIPE